MGLSAAEIGVIGAVAVGTVTSGLALIGTLNNAREHRQSSDADRQLRTREVDDSAFSVLTERLQAELMRSDVKMTALETARDRQVASLEDTIADRDGVIRMRTTQLDRAQGRLMLALNYIAALSQQITDLGHVPEPPPQGLRDTRS